MKDVHQQRHTTRSLLSRKGGMFLRALFLGMSLTLLTFLPLGAFSRTIPTVSAHALPVKTDPASDAVLKTPPQRVTIWFSEALIPQTSRIIVIDTTNHEVDNNDSQVSQANEMSVTLPLLPSGTYVVVWRSQSAFDGHIAGGSFIFRIARPDGTVPPVPAILPTGHIPGAAGNGVPSNTSLDAYTTLQMIMNWLAFLFMTFWIGGLFWETWILPPGKQHDPDLARAAWAASRLFRSLIPITLLLLMFADLGIVCAECAELAGSWSGADSLPLLYVVLFESHFGVLWWIREFTALLALLLSVFLTWKHRSEAVLPAETIPSEESSLALSDPSVLEALAPLPHWWQAVGESLRSIGHLPRRLAVGWREHSWSGRGELVLGMALLLAFALSGHAAAIPSPQLWYALSVDIFHLLGNVTWVGGLFYIGVILVPTLFTLEAHQRARILALGLPAFSAFAIVTWILLAATGSLTTTIHLTSLEQFWTTLYGCILLIKIGIFCLMAVISAYHAFFLRPRLVRTLSPHQEHATLMAFKQAVGERQMLEHAQADSQEVSRAWTVRRQSERLADWLQIEAALGAAVLLCVALLSAFAGTLAATPSSPTNTETTTASSSATNAGTTPNQTAQTHDPFVETQHKQGYSVTLQVSPDSFGTNTFSVKVQDAQGHPAQGSAVVIETTQLDMDMGTQQTQLQAVPSSPGTFAGQSDLTMAGHWQVVVLLLPPNLRTFVHYAFTFSAE